MVKADTKKIFFEVLFYFFNRPIKNFSALIDQDYMITDLLNLLHPVSTENNCAAFLGQLIDLFFYDIGIYRVKTTERLIEDDQLGLVQNRGYELQFLGHSFRKIFYFFIPPALHF